MTEQLTEYLETCMRNRVISESFSEVIISLTKAEEIFNLLKEQEAEIRQLRLALDIATGTCKGIKSGSGQFADMPTMQYAT